MDKDLIRRTYESLKSMNLKDRAKAVRELKNNIDYYFNNPDVSKMYLENNKQNAYNGLIFLRWGSIYKLI